MAAWTCTRGAHRQRRGAARDRRTERRPRAAGLPALSRLRQARGALPLLGVLVAGLAARLGLVGAPQLDYDEGVYWESLRALAHGHPLYREVYSSQPPGFLVLIEPGFLLGGQSIMAARVTVAVLSLALVVGAWLAVRRAAAPAGALAVAVLAAFDPLLLRESVTLQADVPAMALAMLAFGLFVEAGARSGRMALLVAGLAGAAAVAAVLVKFLATPLALGIIAVLAPRRQWQQLAAGAAGGLASAVAILAPFVGELPQLWQQTVLLHLGGRTVPSGWLSRWPVPPEGEVVLVVLAGVGLWLAWRTGSRALLAGWAGWLIAAMLFLMVQRPAYPHHFVAASAPGVMPAGFALQRLGRAAIAPVLGLIAAASLLSVLAWLPPASPVTASRLAAAVPAGRPVVTDDQFLAAAAGVDVPPWLVDTSHLRIESGELTAARIETEIEHSDAGAVVFGTGRLAEVPGLREWVAERFPDRQDLGSGRVVYAQASAQR